MDNPISSIILFLALFGVGPGDALPLKEYHCIVFTDMDNFSSRMAKNDKIVIEQLFRIRNILSKSIKKPGRIVSHMGDSTMISFPNRDMAVSYVMNVSKKVPEPINFGLACGFVYVIEGDIFGAAVNLAARLGEDTARGGQFLTDQGDLTYLIR